MGTHYCFSSQSHFVVWKWIEWGVVTVFKGQNQAHSPFADFSNQTVSGPIDFHCTVYIFFPTMEVNGTRNCLVTDILLSIRKSSEWIRKW